MSREHTKGSTKSQLDATNNAELDGTSTSGNRTTVGLQTPGTDAEWAAATRPQTQDYVGQTPETDEDWEREVRETEMGLHQASEEHAPLEQVAEQETQEERVSKEQDPENQAPHKESPEEQGDRGQTVQGQAVAEEAPEKDEAREQVAEEQLPQEQETPGNEIDEQQTSVKATKPPRTKAPRVDAQTETDPWPKRKDPHVTFTEAKPLLAQADKDPDSPIDLAPESLSSTTGEYDREPPITTKTVKVLKKRPPKTPLVDDSDESANEPYSAFTRSQMSLLTFNAMETDMAPSDVTDMIRNTDSSSILFTSSESLSLDSNGNGSNEHAHVELAGHSLASGLAFIYMVIPPDGGYGWVILILSFLAQLIVDGIIFSIGILLPYIRKDFNASNSSVVLVGSIQIGCYFTGGAISSAFINSYGFRPVCICGVVISSVAILAATFSPNLPLMILFYSAIAGPGLSMIWTSSQLIIGFYFERYRPIASGFSCSGAGAGMLIISLLNTALVPVIDWRNTMRVQVALLIFVFFIGIAYLEVSPTPIGVVAKTEPLPGSSSDEYYGNFYVHNFLRDDTSSKASHILVHYHPEKKPSRLRRIAKCISPCFAREKPQKKEEIALHRSETSLSERKYIIRTDPIQREDLFYTGPADYEEAQQKQQLEGKPLELVGSEKQMQRVAYGLHHIQDYDSPTTSKTRTPGHPAEGRRHKKEELRQHWLKTKIARAFNRLFDFHLLKHFEFRLLLLSAFLYPMGFNIPFVYSRARATIPSNQAFLIGPAIGVTNFLVRIACGFLAYKLRTWTTYVCGGGMFFGGLIVFFSAFFGRDLFWFQILYGICYGVAPAVFATLRALIYVRYLGLAKLTNAFGISALAMGLGVFIGTTSGGVLIEQTGGYTIAFAFSGSCIMIAGGLLLALPTIVRNRDIRKQKKARELNN